ncbi:MAG TPA: ATP-binding protein [Bryobacteraceae bacterium]|nr:ATP-binding protein [Bryobacteraceae bacterium]
MSDEAAGEREREVSDLRDQLDTANRKLAEAHKMASLGRLAAGIVHEINTPVGSILSNNETVRRTIDALRTIVEEAERNNAAPARKATALLESLSSLTAVDKIACERISSVVRSLKTFARVSESDLRRVDVHELILATIKLTGAMYRRRITINTELGDLPEIECYPGLLNQVFLNLIVNAAQAIEGEGSITIRTRPEADCVHIAITDTGCGIPAALRPKIFSAGFTTKPFGEGTGIGLTITREIVVDTHGGTIDFETEDGVGTTFHVRLPINQPRRNPHHQEHA